jgi:hypothetical protein
MVNAYRGLQISVADAELTTGHQEHEGEDV